MNTSGMKTSDDPEESQDSGLVLVPTMIMTFVVGIVVVAVLGYVSTGLRTAQVTTERTDDANVGAAAIYWAMEELANESDPEGICDADLVIIEAPAAAMPNDEAVTVRCDSTLYNGTEGVERVQLSVTSSTSTIGAVAALVDFRPSEPDPRPVRIHSWNP